MQTHTRPPLYQALLLRMWVEQPTHRLAVWRFSLEGVETGERKGFADLDALICHILSLMEQRPEPFDDTAPLPLEAKQALNTCAATRDACPKMVAETEPEA